MFWLMSSSPKTANVLSRPGVLGRLSDAHRRNSVLQSTGFHQCLGLLKKYTQKIPPARPGSTSICASKSTSIYTSKNASICATTWPSLDASVLCSDRQNPVLRPVPETRIPECAQAVKGWPRQPPPPKAARSRAQPKGRARRASLIGQAQGGRMEVRKGDAVAVRKQGQYGVSNEGATKGGVHDDIRRIFRHPRRDLRLFGPKSLLNDVNEMLND